MNGINSVLTVEIYTRSLFLIYFINEINKTSRKGKKSIVQYGTKISWIDFIFCSKIIIDMLKYQCNG